MEKKRTVKTVQCVEPIPIRMVKEKLGEQTAVSVGLEPLDKNNGNLIGWQKLGTTNAIYSIEGKFVGVVKDKILK